MEETFVIKKVKADMTEEEEQEFWDDVWKELNSEEGLGD